jgi:zinc/manganese transport system substrate-binding protein
MRIDNDSHYTLVLILLAFLWLSACNSPDLDNSDRTPVVATTGIIGDVVGNIGGELVEVMTLIPPGADPHDYSPSAQQVAAISQAEFVFANGLGLEEGLIDLLEQAESEGLGVTYLAEHIVPIDRDPHFWHDPVRMSAAGSLIAERIGATSEYLERLEELHGAVEAVLAEIPSERRLLVTGHDSFDYFADRYGFEVVGTLANTSSAGLAQLVEHMNQRRVPAIFVEDEAASELAERIAAEVAHPVAVVRLASESLGEPGTATGTYIDLIRFNAAAIAQALS